MTRPGKEKIMDGPNVKRRRNEDGSSVPIGGVEQEVEVVKQQIQKLVRQIEGVELEIEEVKQQIQGVEQDIEEVKQQMKTCSDPNEKAELRNKEVRLWTDKGHFRTKEEQLRTEEEQLGTEVVQLRTKEERLLEQIQHRQDITPWKRPLDKRYHEFAPSSMNAKNVRRVQIPQGSEEGALYKCGRPDDAVGLEAPLMHAAFGTFVQNLQNSSLPRKEDYAFVRDFCQESSLFYKTERDRQTALTSLLSSYLRMPVSPMKINNFEVDGYIGHPTGFPVYSIIEFENELGSTSVDKFFRGQWYYAEFCFSARASNSSAIFSSCNCPVFLIELRGVQIRISAMAYFDRVHTSMLTNLVNISWPSKTLPHIFTSLKVGIKDLVSFYELVEKRGIASTREDLLDKVVVPYPVWWKPKYTFKELLPQFSGSAKPIILAENDQKQMVLIKFSRRYGEGVHVAWYEAGFAPKLLSIRKLKAGFRMFVMEYLGPPWEMLFLLEPKTRERARVDVRKALLKVHKLHVYDSPNAGSVHGDVRDVNIMVRSHEEGFDVRFVDFDWAGQESVSTYPLNMNLTTIAWPEGVADGMPMLQRHDMEVLNSTSGIAASLTNLEKLWGRVVPRLGHGTTNSGRVVFVATELIEGVNLEKWP